jgi:hypothetical protein
VTSSRLSVVKYTAFHPGHSALTPGSGALYLLGFMRGLPPFGMRLVHAWSESTGRADGPYTPRRKENRPTYGRTETRDGTGLPRLRL